MNRLILSVGGVAAALVVAVVGVAYLYGPTAPGGSTPSPSPSPRPFEGIYGPLEAGTYSVSSVVPAEITFTVPAGWVHHEDSPNLVGPQKESGVGFSFWVVEDVRSDPCKPSSPLLRPPPGPTVDELSSALAAQPNVETSEPAPAQMGGFDGKYLAVTVPANACGYQPWPNPDRLVLPGFGDVELWILDVDGARLVVMAWTLSKASAGDRAELQAVVDSVRIDP